MGDFVLDASIAVGSLLEDEGEGVTGKLEAAFLQGVALVPVIWPLEVANALLNAKRKRRLSDAELSELQVEMAAWPLDVQPLVSFQQLATVVRLADSFGLSVYDGLYLDLAIALELPLATSDKKLIVAAEQNQVQLLP